MNTDALIHTPYTSPPIPMTVILFRHSGNQSLSHPINSDCQASSTNLKSLLIRIGTGRDGLIGRARASWAGVREFGSQSSQTNDL